MRKGEKEGDVKGGSLENGKKKTKKKQKQRN